MYTYRLHMTSHQLLNCPSEPSTHFVFSSRGSPKPTPSQELEAGRNQCQSHSEEEENHDEIGQPMGMFLQLAECGCGILGILLSRRGFHDRAGLSGVGLTHHLLTRSKGVEVLFHSGIGWYGR